MSTMATPSSLQSISRSTMAPLSSSISLRSQHHDDDSAADDSDNDDDSTDDGTTVGATRMLSEDEMDDFLAAEFNSVDHEPVYLPRAFDPVDLNLVASSLPRRQHGERRPEAEVSLLIDNPAFKHQTPEHTVEYSRFIQGIQGDFVPKWLPAVIVPINSGSPVDDSRALAVVSPDGANRTGDTLVIVLPDEANSTECARGGVVPHVATGTPPSVATPGKLSPEAVSILDKIASSKARIEARFAHLRLQRESPPAAPATVSSPMESTTASGVRSTVESTFGLGEDGALTAEVETMDQDPTPARVETAAKVVDAQDTRQVAPARIATSVVLDVQDSDQQHGFYFANRGSLLG